MLGQVCARRVVLHLDHNVYMCLGSAQMQDMGATTGAWPTFAYE